MSAPPGPKSILALLLLRERHLPLALWLAATVVYGAIAGALLYDHPYVAGAVLAAVWLAATWRGIGPLESGPRRRADEG